MKAQAFLKILYLYTYIFIYLYFYSISYFKHPSLGNKPLRDGALPSRTRPLAFKVHIGAEEQTAKFLCQRGATLARNLENLKASRCSTYFSTIDAYYIIYIYNI